MKFHGNPLISSWYETYRHDHPIRYIGDFRCTLFRYLRFRISAVLFQYHEEHQYPIRGHGRSCRAVPLCCERSFTDSPHHFNSGDYKFVPLMVYHSENTRAGMSCISRFTRFRFSRRFAGSHPPRITRVTFTLILYTSCKDHKKNLCYRTMQGAPQNKPSICIFFMMQVASSWFAVIFP
jgi:hypothetical protein